MTLFLSEPWERAKSEILAMTPLHYAEASAFRKDLALMQLPNAPAAVFLSPDVPRLDWFSGSGAMNCTVGRDRGRLVAYHLSLLSRHLHYDLRIGNGDVHFILPSHRRGRNALLLWQAVHEGLAKRGVTLACERTGVDARARGLLDHLGYVKTDELWAKWL